MLLGELAENDVTIPPQYFRSILNRILALSTSQRKALQLLDALQRCSLHRQWSYTASGADWDSILSLTLFLEGLAQIPKEFYECGKQMLERVCGVLRIILRIDCTDDHAFAVSPTEHKTVKRIHDTLVRLCAMYSGIHDKVKSTRPEFVSFIGDYHYLQSLVSEICAKALLMVKDEHLLGD